MNSKFKDYLPPNIIQEGIDLCLQNVKDLLLECKLLLRKKKYSRAMALSITTLEEIGKINVLRSINRIPKKR
ncbi:unnamed protein product [marine sediment metagenome]|uniref:Uncharacterized protein n=1 Tax=marine sediment metagenome TaxID=412755 RepID=X1J0S5_9ZZZZ